jgi:GDP-L-fucose synthase
VVVTGAHGFIGRHVVTALETAGHDVVSIAHPDRVEDPVDRITRLADLSDPGAARAALDGAEVVVHLAARAGGIAFQQAPDRGVFGDNRSVTDNVLNAARATGTRRVFIASSLVVYLPSDEPLTEDHPLLEEEDEPSPYAWSKIVDERRALDSGLEVVVGRFGNVYGPGAPFHEERASVVHALIARCEGLAAGEPLRVWGDGSAVRSFVFVEDVARAVAMLIGPAAPGGVYNVDSGVPVTIAELAAVVASHADPVPAIEFDRSKPAGSPIRVGAIDRLRELGFEPGVALGDGIGRTVEHYRQRNSA